MDNEKDELWTSLMQECEMGSQFGFERVEESDIYDVNPGSVVEEASSSSNELAENSISPVHLKNFGNGHFRRGPRAKRCGSELQHPMEKDERRPFSPLCSPNTSCLGKRDRNHESKTSGKQTSKERAVAVKESKWAVQLLRNCAEAIASNNIHRTQHLMWVLNDLGCLTGDANQRLAAYGLKALFGKVAGTVSAASTYHQSFDALYSSSSLKNVHNALLKFHDLHPWHQMVYAVTNGVLMDALEGKDLMHVIDVGLSQGTQWPTLIEALATRPSGPPSLLKLTIVEDPCASWSPEAAAEVKNRLERFAKVMGLNMELRVLMLPVVSLTRDVLSLAEGEAVAVCVQFSLSKLSTGDSRDEILGFFRAEVQPDIMILGENDSDGMAEDFLTVFEEVISHFWRFLDSMSSAFKGQDCEERQIIEHLFSQSMIKSIAGDLERIETHGSWNARMRKAGFVAESPHDEVTETVRMLVKKNDLNWELRNQENCLVLLWKQQPVTFCSVWKS